jgi:hypothetical protein
MVLEGHVEPIFTCSAVSAIHRYIVPCSRISLLKSDVLLVLQRSHSFRFR